MHQSETDKARQAKYRSTPEYKAKQRAYQSTPEYRDKGYRSVESKERDAIHKTEYRASVKAYYIGMMGNKCSACKQSFPAICYDFHHVDPSTKENQINLLFNRQTKTNHKGRQTLEIELSKCVLVCALCHRLIHASLIECPSISVKLVECA